MIGRLERRRGLVLVLVTGCLASVLSFEPVWLARAEWSAVAEQRTSFTTDAFQFSSARRLRFSEDPSLPTVVPLKKPEDVIWEPSVEVIKTFAPKPGKTEVSIKAHGYIYTDKPIFNHGDYRFQVRQSLGPQTSLLLRYRHVPNLFLGPNFERRTGLGLVQEERVTTNKWRLEVERELSDQWTATLVGRYGLRSYNEAFAERDTRFWTVGPRLTYRVTAWATASLAYLYERGSADGAGDTRFNDDVSYRLHHVSADAEFQLGPSWSLTLGYTFQRKHFTSELRMDTHFGRQDSLHQGIAEIDYKAGADLTVFLGFQQTQRTSSSALRGFNDTIASLGGRVRF
jgi:hypothetical protein